MNHPKLCTALMLATGVAVAFASHTARACDYATHPAPVNQPVPPTALEPPPPAPAYAIGAPAAVEYRPAHWRMGWEMHRLRREYRRLDFIRDPFYATWDGNRWRRDRFEAWYGARRAAAELHGWHHGRWDD
jgi:hypothetical protein